MGIVQKRWLPYFSIFVLLVITAALDTVVLLLYPPYSFAFFSPIIPLALAALTFLCMAFFLSPWHRLARILSSILIGFSWGLLSTKAFLHLSQPWMELLLPLLALLPPTALFFSLLLLPAPPYRTTTTTRQHATDNRKWE